MSQETNTKPEEDYTLSIHPKLGITYVQLVYLLKDYGLMKHSVDGFISVPDLIEILDLLGVEHNLHNNNDLNTTS